ncbi:hypothetical protein, partial [Staphylococcus phage KSAP7]
VVILASIIAIPLFIFYFYFLFSLSKSLAYVVVLKECKNTMKYIGYLVVVYILSCFSLWLISTGSWWLLILLNVILISATTITIITQN